MTRTSEKQLFIHILLLIADLRDMLYEIKNKFNIQFVYSLASMGCVTHSVEL